MPADTDRAFDSLYARWPNSDTFTAAVCAGMVSAQVRPAMQVNITKGC